MPKNINWMTEIILLQNYTRSHLKQLNRISTQACNNKVMVRDVDVNSRPTTCSSRSFWVYWSRIWSLFIFKSPGFSKYRQICLICAKNNPLFPIFPLMDSSNLGFCVMPTDGPRMEKAGYFLVQIGPTWWYILKIRDQHTQNPLEIVFTSPSWTMTFLLL